MTPMNRTVTIGRMMLLILILALGLAGGSQTATACSDTAERYPMLIGSGYEGEPCDLAEWPCSDTAARYPMLIGSGYEGVPCRTSPVQRVADVSQPPSATWQETMLDGSGYEPAAIAAVQPDRDRD